MAALTDWGCDEIAIAVNHLSLKAPKRTYQFASPREHADPLVVSYRQRYRYRFIATSNHRLTTLAKLNGKTPRIP